MSRRGFTLIEVAFAIAIVSAAVLTVLLLIGSGLRTQERSRYGFYAATVTVGLMERFSQPREDFGNRENLGRDPGNLWSRVLADNNGGNAVDTRGIGREIVQEGTPYLGPGQPDLERALFNGGQGIYPVPLAIARRLDSPGDEIRHVLDAGGHLYYCDPSGRSESMSQILAGGERGAPAEVQKLVFAVLGEAQQNLLPYDPVRPMPRQLYPFPPLAEGSNKPRAYTAVANYSYTPVVVDRGVASGEGPQGDLRAVVESTAMKDRLRHGDPYEESATWELENVLDRDAGRSALGDGSPWTPASSWSPWAAGVAEFRRLSFHHWQRISHQIASQSVVPEGGGGSTSEWEWDGQSYKDVQITDYEIYIDQANNQHSRPRTRTIRVPDTSKGRWVTKAASAAKLWMRGLPAPVNGLPMAKQLRGTDIAYEDQQSCAKDRLGQLRLGMPSLERRVMYRTAALALWAKVCTGRSAISAEAGILGTGGDPGTDPNRIDNPSAIPAGMNPLLQVVDAPADRSRIHPAQVLALAHLAHAAVMVTGYQPPFMDESNSIDPADHKSVAASDDTLPYKALSDVDYPLWDPGVAADDINPDSEQAAATWANVPAGKECRDMSGAIIRLRRYQGEVINPNPGPYADRGAFDWQGRPLYTTAFQPNGVNAAGGVLRRIVSHGDAGLRGCDTAYARNAVETALRWAYAYVVEHPGDFRVPRPVNAPAFNSQPLLSWDIFDATGKARRSGDPDVDRYNVLWGGDQLDLGLAEINPLRVLETGGERNYDAAADGRVDHLAIGSLDMRIATGKPAGWTSSWWENRGCADILRRYAAYHGRPNPVAVTPAAAMADRRVHFGASDQRDRFWQPRRFAVADRCRHLAFWAVDWKAYEDAESQPCEPPDRTWLPLYKEMRGWDMTATNQMRLSAWLPERLIAWANPARDGTGVRPSPYSQHLINANGGNDMWFDMRQDAGGSGMAFTNICYDPADPCPWFQLGRWGADRNGNGTWDRGPVPASARMRAEMVARFVFYDPVMRTHVRY